MLYQFYHHFENNYLQKGKNAINLTYKLLKGYWISQTCLLKEILNYKQKFRKNFFNHVHAQKGNY